MAIAAYAGLPVLAQDETPVKPFQQWTKAEVNKILTDSPWARTQAVRIQRRGQVRSIAGQTESGTSLGGQTASRKGELSSAEDPIDYRFPLRLHSALPIRQALVRKEQLKWNYDQKSSAEQKAFDTQAREMLLKCGICAENYVVSVGFSSNNTSGNDLIYKWFASATVPSLRGYIILSNERGERRDLIEVIPPSVAGDDVFFVFPKLDLKGQPLFSLTDKKLIFRMSDSSANAITNFSLDLSKVVIDGKLPF